VSGLVKPWGQKFVVTTKGLSTDQMTIQWSILVPYALVAAATVLGVLINLAPFSALHGRPMYSMNVFWSIFSIVVLCITCAVCVEPPKRRRDERFSSNEQATVIFRGQAPRYCSVLDISLGGARLSRDGGWAIAPIAGELVLIGDTSPFPFRIVHVDASGDLAVHFDLGVAARRVLIRRLFTGRYRNEVQRVNVLGSLGGALRKVFA